MRLTFHTIALMFLVSQSAAAAGIVGQGWGDTEVAAKREALADISSRVSVTVRSWFKTTQTVTKTVGKAETVNQASENMLETDSELPILGATYVARKEGAQVSVTAILETAKALPLYESRLRELRSRIAALDESMTRSKAGEARYNRIMDMLTLLDEFRKLNTVAIYLGGKPQAPGITEDALRDRLRAVTKRVDSLDLAARLLTEGITETGVYVYPARAGNSSEITPFAALLKEKLSTHLRVALDPRDAAYTLVGRYQESAGGIDITYHLVDRDSLARKTYSVHILKQAYAGMETVPKTLDFDQLLKAGVALSGNLRVDVTTNIGNHDLLFKEGDEVEFLVKLSEPGYFYVLGHAAKKTESNTYLVKLHQAEGPRKFVYFVNADDANKWISIGRFVVIAPFGVEGIQVFASNKDLVDALPSVSLDPKTGLYLVSDTPKEGILNTRAIIKKFSQTSETSEASLMFTTEAK